MSTYSPAIVQQRREQCSRSSRICISGSCPLSEVETRAYKAVLMVSSFADDRRACRLPQKTLLSSLTFGSQAAASLRRLASFRSRFDCKLSVRFCQAKSEARQRFVQRSSNENTLGSEQGNQQLGCFGGVRDHPKEQFYFFDRAFLEKFSEKVTPASGGIRPAPGTP